MDCDRNSWSVNPDSRPARKKTAGSAMNLVWAQEEEEKAFATNF